MSSLLLVGGARSGKSTLAQELAESTGDPVTIVVTGQASDTEMAERIDRHRQERPDDWETIESPLAVVEAVGEVAVGACLVIDCITVWLSNLMMAETSQDAIEGKVGELATILAERQGTTLVVSNEVGQGIVPMGELSRRFRDVQGRANQILGSALERTYLVIAGGVVEVRRPVRVDFGPAFSPLNEDQ